MRKLVYGAFACLAMTLGTGAEAARMPSSGPDPSWSESQKFEWYLGYMSDAAAICREYSASNALADIAKLSPFGRVGLNSISGDGFTGAACGRIRDRVKELLQKKETYIRYLTEKYDCGPAGQCTGPAADPLASSHTCATQVREALGGIDVDAGDVARLTVQSWPPGPSNGAEPRHRARIQFKSCNGSLYIDLGDRCEVEQSYTRGNCEFSGVSAY